jgi:predicted enzyme related to lactoylglutathione lyase
MTQPVTYVELSSPDVDRSTAFFEAVFGWQFQPFVSPVYLVAPGAAGGVDTGLLPSRDGAPRAVPVIRVPSLDAATADVLAHGGALVVPPFAVTGVGRGCYVTDPAGLLIGLHEYDPDAG